MKRWIGWLLIGTISIFLPLSAAGKTSEQERRIGKDAADQIAKDKTTKFVTDPAIVERVERIGRVVAAYADEPDLTYSFKVIDSPIVNAFSLPGGYIYLYKGLIDQAESDDELAGVIGHEICHAAHHHVLREMQKQKKMDWATLALLLAGALTGANVADAATLSQYITLAGVNGFGIKLESEADRYAVLYLSKSPYNPVGMLTFTERMAHDDAWKGTSNIELGVYQDHPLSEERAKALHQLLDQMGIPIDRRKVMSSLRVVAKEGKIDDQPSGEIWLGKMLIASVAGDGTISPLRRAQGAATRLDTAMDQKLGVGDVRIGSDERTIWVGKSLILTILPSDAKLFGKTEEEIAKQVQKSLQTSLWKQYYNTLY